MQEFVNTEKYGKLYIDRILFESNFPIIFTCKNDADEIFICVCCQNNIKGCKWLVGKTDAINIIRMLKDELTLRELVREYQSIILMENIEWNIIILIGMKTAYIYLKKILICLPMKVNLPMIFLIILR